MSSNGSRPATLGVIGGVGPETTAEFYLGLLDRCKELYPEAYPHVLIDSIPVPFDVEQELVLRGSGIEAYEPLLLESVTSLERAGADVIALPCNTLHEFHEILQAAVAVPVLNILEATATACREAGYSTVAVLGTPRTIKTKLYESSLERVGIASVTLTPEEISETATIIYDLIAGRQREKHRRRLVALLAELGDRGAHAAVLGCTDLQLAVRPGDADLPIAAVDSVQSLVELTARKLARQS